MGLTLGQYPDSLAEVAGLAVRPPCIFKHTHDETKFAEEAVLSWAVCGYMRLRESSDWECVMH